VRLHVMVEHRDIGMLLVLTPLRSGRAMQGKR
jgi:hypothetical protein